MPFNLIEAIKIYLNEEFINKAITTLEENRQGISKALSAIIPIELAGILSKATSGPEGAADIYGMAKKASNITSVMPLVQKEEGLQSESEIPALFGNNLPELINGISEFSGIKNSSAKSLMNSCLPAVLGTLGKHAEEKGLSSSGLSGFIASQKNYITQLIPSQLSSFATRMGLRLPATPKLISSYNESKKGNKWLVLLILIIAVLALLFYFSRSCNQTKPSLASTYGWLNENINR